MKMGKKKRAISMGFILFFGLKVQLRNSELNEHIIESHWKNVRIECICFFFFERRKKFS